MLRQAVSYMDYSSYGKTISSHK